MKNNADELRAMVIELGLVEESQFDALSAAATDRKRTVWALMREEGLLNQPQADGLEMASKGYMPVTAARANLEMEARRSVRVSQVAVKKPQIERSVAGGAPGGRPAPPAGMLESESSHPVIQRGGQGRGLISSAAVKRPPAVQLRGESTSPQATSPDIVPPPEAPQPRTPSRTRAVVPQVGPASRLVGQDLGKYRIVSQVGRGASGSVFLGHHILLNIPVAIKILDPALAAANPDLLRRFLHEARSAARISHPNLIRVLDCDAVEGYHLIAMEYVDGISGSELLKINKRLNEETALSIILAVANGLEAALAAGIIHRDIKPANIMITKNDQVKVADLGLAKHLEAESTLDDTRPGIGLGTPHYFAPEQAQNASCVDHRADIYALGCSLYHMLAGEVPFSGRSIPEMIAKHASEPAVPIAERRPDITPATSEMVARMMAKTPDGRHGDYQALICEINECIVAHGRRMRGEDSSARQTGFFRMMSGFFGGKK